MPRFLLCLAAVGLLFLAGCRGGPAHQAAFRHTEAPFPVVRACGERLVEGTQNIIESDIVTCILAVLAGFAYFARAYQS